MIVWSSVGAVASVTPTFVDNGGTIRGATNAAGLRVDRLGSHYRAAITIGIGINRITIPMTPVTPAISVMMPAIRPAPKAASSPITGMTAANISAPGMEFAIGSGKR